MGNNDPVGVFDSGAGGISVLREAIRQLPSEHFLYFGDTRYAPYGTKTREAVLGRVRAVVDILMAEHIKALVIACNTATGAAAAELRAELRIPVIGMEPALKPAQAARKNGQVLVLATPLTLNQDKFARLMSRYGEGAVKVPCPGLMELVEQDDGLQAGKYLEALFAQFDLDQVDAVVLGCTHYVFLRGMIRDMLPDRIVLTDGNEGTVRQLRRVLADRGILREEGPGGFELRTSGADRDLAVWRRLLDSGMTAVPSSPHSPGRPAQTGGNSHG